MFRFYRYRWISIFLFRYFRIWAFDIVLKLRFFFLSQINVYDKLNVKYLYLQKTGTMPNFTRDIAIPPKYRYSIRYFSGSIDTRYYWKKSIDTSPISARMYRYCWYFFNWRKHCLLKTIEKKKKKEIVCINIDVECRYRY